MAMTTLIDEIESIAPLGHDMLAAYAVTPEIPRRRYTDPRLYDLELERVFRGTWLPVANACELPKPGSYLTFDLGYAPVVVVRGKDNVIRAFLNSCAHRGAPVAREASGCASRLTCRYHAWTYDLEGNLLGIPGKQDFGGLDRTGLGLRALRCEQWGELVFISFAQDAAPLDEWLAPFDRRYRNIVSTPLRLADRRSRTLECNWKAAVEAFYEGYHLPSTHTQTAALAFDAAETRYQVHANGHGSMFLRYHPQALSRQDWRNGLATIPGSDFGGFAVSIGPFPNALISLQPFGYQLMMFWPEGVSRTRLDVAWYGLDWGTEALPEAWQGRLENWEMLLDEDVASLGPIQRSIEADVERGVPVCTQECRLLHFHASIDRTIGRDRIPPELRAPDLLGGYLAD